MKKTLSALVCLLALFIFGSIQLVHATGNHQAIGFIQFAYVGENEDPFVIIPQGGGCLGIPASAIVYDDRAVEITFFCSLGAADAEICDGDIVVGTWHKPSGTQTMTIRLPALPRDYTIYLYLQNGITLKGEYTVE